MDTKQDEQNVHILQRVVEELKKETNNFYVFLQSEGGKDLVKKYKVTHHVALLSFVHLLSHVSAPPRTTGVAHCPDAARR